MREKPSDYVLDIWVKRIYEIPEYFEELDTIDLKELLKFVQKEVHICNFEINDFILRNPEYKYPEEYKDKKYRYWLKTIHRGFISCMFYVFLSERIEKKLSAELPDLSNFQENLKTKKEQVTFEVKPVLKPETVQIVFDILKDFFGTEQQNELNLLLETGNDASEHLIFLDNGNRLADAFKQLKKADIITGCEQKELENWIARNFKYRYRKEIKEYTSRYLSDIISTNKDKCQKPLLNVTKERVTGEIKIKKV